MIKHNFPINPRDHLISCQKIMKTPMGFRSFVEITLTFVRRKRMRKLIGLGTGQTVSEELAVANYASSIVSFPVLAQDTKGSSNQHSPY